MFLQQLQDSKRAHHFLSRISNPSRALMKSASDLLTLASLFHVKLNPRQSPSNLSYTIALILCHSALLLETPVVPLLLSALCSPLAAPPCLKTNYIFFEQQPTAASWSSWHAVTIFNGALFLSSWAILGCYSCK